MSPLALSSVIIATHDKARLVAFYRDILGISVNEQGKLESMGIIIHPARHSAVQGPPVEPHRVMLTFATDDIHTTARVLGERGVAFVRAPEKEWWGGWIATFRDPDGNFLQLIQLPSSEENAAPNVL
jgi:predicted enzyme related to lactoylglutathione lyase